MTILIRIKMIVRGVIKVKNRSKKSPQKVIKGEK